MSKPTFRVVQKYPDGRWSTVSENTVHSAAIASAAAHAATHNMADVGVYHTGSGEWVAYFYPLTDKVLGR